MKEMLSTDELIQHMKDKGITFKEVSEDEARDFFGEQQLYYMKLASYRANHNKCEEGRRKGQYGSIKRNQNSKVRSILPGVD